MRRIIRLVFSLAFIISAVGRTPVSSETVPTPTWSAYIAYYNPRTDTPLKPDRLTVIFYKPDGTGIPVNVDLPFGGGPHTSGKLYIGSTLRNPGFKGSVVISSTTQMMAVYREITEDEEAFSPILYNSFNIADAGGGRFFIPFLQRTAAFNPLLSVQNVESVPVSIQMTFYPKAGGTPLDITPPSNTIPPQASIVYEASGLGLGPVFEGSLVVDAVIDGINPVQPARIVAGVRAIQSGGRRAYAYEGLANGDSAIYIPTAMCRVGTGQMTGFYDVQNTGDVLTDVRVEYYNPVDGSLIGEVQNTGSLLPGGMLEVNPCDIKEMDGRSASAVIRASGEGEIAAIGRTISKDGLMTAFSGQKAVDPGSYGFECIESDPEYPGNCHYRVILPYVEYSTHPSGWRTFLTIQNIEDKSARDIQVRYYGQDGALIGTHYLATDASEGTLMQAFTKRSSDPTFANAVDPNSLGFIGGVEVYSDVQVAVLARIQRSVSRSEFAILGEDYTGMYLLNDK